MDHKVIVPTDCQIRSIMWEPHEYDGIDPGIRFAVKVLHAEGIETCQSCQGGEGHSYPEPTIDLPTASDDAEVFGALAALRSYGLPVVSVGIIWNVKMSTGLPYEKISRITFGRTMEDQVDDWPMFQFCYRATPAPDLTKRREEAVWRAERQLVEAMSEIRHPKKVTPRRKRAK